jgi:RNA polymerase sigma factor (sigma-70 family)
MARKKKAYQFFPSDIELLLLEEVQKGNLGALLYLLSGYVWFIKKLAKAYTPKSATKTTQTAVFTAVLEVFETCAGTVTLTEDTCFLEEVLRTTEERLGEAAVRRKRADRLKAMRDREADCTIYTISLDTPLPGTDTLTLGETLPDQSPSVVREVYQTQLRDQVPKLLESLPEDERTVITLHLLEDLTLEEVAGQLGVRTERVRQKFKKGMRRLRCTLGLQT